MMLINRSFIAALVLSFLSPAGFSDEIKTTAADQVSLHMTIYNGGRALVRDSRQVDLEKRANSIAFMDVAEKIIPQTVAINGVDVLEQNYDYDLLSPQALVQKNIGNTVRIARRSSDSGETLEWLEGKILSANGGVVIQMKDGSLESLSSVANYHMVFDRVPDNLRTSPTLSLQLKQPSSGKRTIDTTYLTGGLRWHSDYILQLDKSETRADLDSWITLENHSGISYHNAHLQLLAGDVNLQPARPDNMARAELMMSSRKVMSDINEQALHGYHLYTVPHQTTLRDKQSKQIKLFSTTDIPVHKKLEDRASVDTRGMHVQKSKADQILVFQNSKPSLGMPLPKGTVRVYAEDENDRQQFIGEDAINHSAVNDSMEIRLGKSFDISLQRRTISVQQLSKKQQLLRREIRINNGSKKNQAIKVYEIMPTQEWSIRQSSHKHKQDSPPMAEFDITLPALKETVLEYEVVISYP